MKNLDYKEECVILSQIKKRKTYNFKCSNKNKNSHIENKALVIILFFIMITFLLIKPLNFIHLKKSKNQIGLISKTNNIKLLINEKILIKP